jgi:hypothetical protein
VTLSCQLIDPEPVEPEDTLAQRIRSRGDVKTFAKKLTATQKVSTLCMDDPLEDHIHILVKVKPISKSVRSPVDQPSLTKALFTTFVSLSLYYSHHCTSWFRSSSSLLSHPPILTSPFVFPSMFAHSLFASISSISHFILLL